MATYIYATCWQKDKKKLEHPECSSACPHVSAWLRSGETNCIGLDDNKLEIKHDELDLSFPNFVFQNIVKPQRLKLHIKII